MEYAIDENSHSYAGGLGILAGDYLLEAADQNVPIIAIGLHYGKDISSDFSLLDQVQVPMQDEDIIVNVWQKNFGKSVTLLLIDTDVKGNSDVNRAITSRLYDADFYVRLKQEMLLGIGGVKVLKQFKIEPRVYHLNEGHTAFAALGIMAFDPENQRKIVATKHTIFPNAGSKIMKVDFEKYIKPFCVANKLDPEKIYEMGKFDLDANQFSTTRFLIQSARQSNGVSVLHTVYEKKVHPQSNLIPITNGVYRSRWEAKEWGGQAENLSNREFWEIKNRLRSKLLSFVEERTTIELDPNICTAVWARRFAEYKRPTLLFSDLARLEKIIHRENMPIQLIISGKAHPADAMGMEAVDRIVKLSKTPEFKGKIAYVPDYDINIAKYLDQGADIWINTPIRGKEACGTSGIKASLNGALQCSVSDGWVDEVDWTGTGWVLDENDTANALYGFLEKEIPEVFYKKDDHNLPNELIERMKKTMKIVKSNFTAHRMLKDYLEKLY